MSKMPGLLPLRPHEDVAASVETPPPPVEKPRQTWQGLLRPQFVEKAVLAVDVIFIVLASLACSWGYSWVATVDPVSMTAFAGLGTIVAVNFTAMMAARQNYSLKN